MATGWGSQSMFAPIPYVLGVSRYTSIEDNRDI